MSQSKLIKTIGGLISRDDRVKTAVEEIRKIQWGVEDILKSTENAQVVLSFNYKDRITGTVGLSMIKVEEEWKIGGLEYLKLKQIEPIAFVALESVIERTSRNIILAIWC